MSERLLMMVASRGRPEQLQTMLDSFEKTKSPGTEIAIYLMDDDPRIPDYLSIIRGYHFFIDRPRSQTEVFNLFPSCCSRPYYGTVNDDHVFVTPGWDKKMIEAIEKNSNGWGEACANDLMNDWSQHCHPGAEIISGNIVQALGYYIWPDFRHVGIDHAHGLLFSRLGRLNFLEDVVIEHRHVFVGKAAMDENYKWIYGAEEQAYGHAKEAEYEREVLPREIARIQEAMAHE